jgi:cation transporter-like permease
MILAWGAICMAHAGINNRQTLIALRLLLGAAEAGFVPSVFVSLVCSSLVFFLLILVKFYLSTWTVRVRSDPKESVTTLTKKEACTQLLELSLVSLQ